MEDKEQNEEPKSLIDMEAIFRQRQLGGTSLANLAIQALEPYLDDLPRKSRIFSMGNSQTKGGIFDTSIRNLGNFQSKDITVVNSLTTIGNATVNELLVVKEGSNLTGNIYLKSNAIFAGDTSLTGTIISKGNIITSEKISLNGTIRISKQILSDGEIHLRGNSEVEQLQSLSSVFARGTIKVKQDIRAKRFQIKSGTGSVGGDIFARDIGIGSDRQLKRYMRNFEDQRNLNNPINLIKYIGKIIISPLTGRNKSKEPLHVEGDIIGDEIFLENVIVEGDINARKITIGDNVEITGNVEYSDDLTVLTNKQYNSTLITEDEIRYIDFEELMKLEDSSNLEDE